MNLKFVERFLLEYSEFSIKPTVNDYLVLSGEIKRSIRFKEYEPLEISYSLTILIPADYPFNLPIVYENKNQIEKISSNHINPDGSFCLGSPIRLKLVLKKSVDFKAFFESCVLPYLYAVTINQENGQGFVFGELEHGNEGLVSDFKNLFHLQTEENIYQMLKVLANKKKRANKMDCPCGCSKRVTQCKYFDYVIKMRKTFPRKEWEWQYKLIGGGV